MQTQTKPESIAEIGIDAEINAVETAAPKKKRKKKRIVLITTAAVLAIALVFTLVSPLPVSYMVRLAFLYDSSKEPDGYDDIKSRVSVMRDLKYPSKYKDNSADIYILKDAKEPLSVVLWVHGGAFVGGDKRDAEIYATALASEGYAVVCINYRRAPEAKYPAPVIQTGEAYLWIKTLADSYPMDAERLVLAGDSAGAHIAAQFAAIQSNGEYAKEMAIEPIVPLEFIKATLLFCGPFDTAKILAIDSSIMNFLMGKAAWAYFGEKAWEGKFASQATVTDYITADFPPSFISDGNTLSFEEHGRALAEELEKKGVPVETYFVSAEEEVTKHEYQFVMNTPAAKKSFEKALAFLKKYTA